MVDLSHCDFEAIVDQKDKLDEAAYFFAAARQQTKRSEFRWLISAFFNAAYSYFDTAAMHACHATTGEDGESSADSKAIEILGKYVKVDPRQVRRTLTAFIRNQ